MYGRWAEKFENKEAWFFSTGLVDLGKGQSLFVKIGLPGNARAAVLTRWFDATQAGVIYRAGAAPAQELANPIAPSWLGTSSRPHPIVASWEVDPAGVSDAQGSSSYLLAGRQVVDLPAQLPSMSAFVYQVRNDSGKACQAGISLGGYMF